MNAEGRNILSSYGGITENSCLLGCNAVSLGVWFPTFRSTIVSSKSLKTSSHIPPQPED